MKIRIDSIKNIKITTFLIMGLFLLIFSLIMIFYYLPKPGGESMAVFGYFLYFVISIVMILIDRLLVKIVKTGLLSMIEIIVILVFILTILIIYHNG